MEIEEIENNKIKQTRYNKLLDELILWNFYLSVNYNSYKNSDKKSVINEKYNYGDNISARLWNSTYSDRSNIPIMELFSYAINQLNLDYSKIIADITIRVNNTQLDNTQLDNTQLDDKLLTEEEKEEKKERQTKLDKLINSLQKFHSEKYRHRSPRKRIADCLGIKEECIEDVNIGVNNCKKVLI